LQCLHGTSKINWGNLNNTIHGASRHFKNKEKQYLKDKNNELALKIKNKNPGELYRGIHEFNRSYQPRSNMVIDQPADSCNI
jgi:hypothetical protein